MRFWIAAASVLMLVRWTPPAEAQTAYQEPDLKKEIFRSSALSLDPTVRARTATLLAVMVRNHSNLNPANTDSQGRAARFLGIALRLDPQNKAAYVANVKLKAGECPAPVEDAPSKEEAIKELMTTTSKLRLTEKSDDIALTGYLLALLEEADPGNDEIVFEYAQMKENGLSIDWSWAPARNLQAASSPATAATKLPVAASGPLGAVARPQSTVKGLFVNILGNGEMIGTVIDITATATAERVLSSTATVSGQDGKGTRTLNLAPAAVQGEIGEEMAISLEEAVRTARLKHPEWNARQINISFGDKYSMKDGGSAGTAFTLLLLAVLDGFEIDPKCAVTGDIAVNGNMLRVGGITDKIRAATDYPCDAVIIPQENRPDLADTLLLQSNSVLWKIQVFTPATLEEAAALVRKDRSENTAKAIRLFAEIQPALKKGALDAARNPDTKAKLKQVLELCPSHASAEFILQLIEGRGAKKLTLSGSLNELFTACHMLVPLIWDDRLPGNLRQYLSQPAMDAIDPRLSKLRHVAHEDVRSLVTAFSEFSKEVERLREVEGKPQTQTTGMTYKKYREKLRTKLSTMGQNKEMMEKILRGK